MLNREKLVVGIYVCLVLLFQLEGTTQATSDYAGPPDPIYSDNFTENPGWNVRFDNEIYSDVNTCVRPFSGRGIVLQRMLDVSVPFLRFPNCLKTIVGAFTGSALFDASSDEATELQKLQANIERGQYFEFFIDDKPAGSFSLETAVIKNEDGTIR